MAKAAGLSVVKFSLESDCGDVSLEDGNPVVFSKKETKKPCGEGYDEGRQKG